MKRSSLVFLLVCLLTTLAQPAWSAPNVTLTARLAYEGRVRPGGWTTVFVELTNQGGAITGEIIVDGGSGPWARPQYVVPVSLPAGGKKRVPVEVPLTEMGKVHVSFTAGGDTLETKPLDLAVLAPNTLLVGVFTKHELGIPALGQIEPSNGTVKVAGGTQMTRLDPESFPSRAPLLDGFDVIALANFDSSSLSAEQLKALEAWVSRGGTLLLAGGPEWKRTIAPLPGSIVPVAVTGTGTADLSALGNGVQKPLTGQAPVSQARLIRGDVLASAGDLPLLTSTQVGAGKVLYLAADPGLAPLVAWPGLADLFGRSLTITRDFNQMEWGAFDGRMQGALRRIPGMGLPPLSVVLLLLGSYLLLIGPVNYLVLKRFDRRELSWVTIPATSVLFVGAVWLFGFGDRGTMISHMLTVTELAPGATTATTTSLVGVYAPTRSNVDVSVEDVRLVKPLYIWSMGQPDVAARTRIVAGERTTVELRGLNDYSMQGFSAEQDVPVKGGLELVDATIDETGTLTARVVNKLDQPVSDLRMTMGSESVQLGELAPGATSEPVTIGLGGIRDPKGQWEMFRGRSSPADYRNADKMRRIEMLEAVLFTDPDRLMNEQVYVTGFTPEPIGSLKLPELGRLYAGENLVFVKLPLPVNVATGDLPPGIVLGNVTGGPAWHREGNLIMIQEGSYTFTLQLPEINHARVAELKLHLRTLTRPEFTQKVKNQKTKQWVELPVNEEVHTLPNWQEFVSPGGIIELQMDVKGGRVEMVPPTVSLKGVAR